MARPSMKYQAFTFLVDRLLTVPKAVVVERMAVHGFLPSDTVGCESVYGCSGKNSAIRVG